MALRVTVRVPDLDAFIQRYSRHVVGDRVIVCVIDESLQRANLGSGIHGAAETDVVRPRQAGGAGPKRARRLPREISVECAAARKK